ncbi:hypothetical protein AAG663_20640 [Bacillus licheniformis]
MRAVSVKSDFYALGHFALFLLYSGFTPSDEEEKCWEEELSISSGLKSVLRKMLQIDLPYERAEDIIGDLISCTAEKEEAAVLTAALFPCYFILTSPMS